MIIPQIFAGDDAVRSMMFHKWDIPSLDIVPHWKPPHFDQIKDSCMKQWNKTKDEIAYASQVHWSHIINVKRTGLQWEADALITDIPGIVLQIVTADCIPLLVVWKTKKWFSVVAAIHSGWKSSIQNIVPKTIQKMIDNYGVVLETFLVWVWPSISVNNFQFGVECFDLFPTPYITTKKTEPETYYVDLWLYIYDQLIAVGLVDAQIQRDLSCTFGELARFFSYRRDGATGKRLFSWIVIDDILI